MPVYVNTILKDLLGTAVNGLYIHRRNVVRLYSLKAELCSKLIVI